MERNYVVVCNEHKGIDGSLLFWGNKTEDNAKRRSFGGYTSDFNRCERYTLEEIEKSGYHFPIYGENISHDNWQNVEDFAIDINGLKELGYRKMTIWYH